MSADDSTLSTDSSVTTVIAALQPVDADGTPIIWDGNDATIAGILHEVFKFLKRKGLMQMFIKHRAVPVKGGKLAIDSFDTVLFVEGTVVDERGDKPTNVCPPTPERISEYEARQALAGAASAYTAKTALTPPQSLAFVYAPHEVVTADGTFLTVLLNTFGHTDISDELADDADGSGFARQRRRRPLGLRVF